MRHRHSTGWSLLDAVSRVKEGVREAGGHVITLEVVAVGGGRGSLLIACLASWSRLRHEEADAAAQDWRSLWQRPDPVRA
jgi:hypothetical protein